MQAELIINWPLQTKNPFYDYWDSFNLKFSVFVVYRPVHNMDTTSTTRSASWEDFNKDPTASYLDLHIIRPQHRPQLDPTPASLIHHYSSLVTPQSLFYTLRKFHTILLPRVASIKTCTTTTRQIHLCLMKINLICCQWQQVAWAVLSRQHVFGPWSTSKHNFNWILKEQSFLTMERFLAWCTRWRQQVTRYWFFYVVFSYSSHVSHCDMTRRVYFLISWSCTYVDRERSKGWY